MKLKTFEEIHDEINSRKSMINNYVNIGRQNACNDFWHEMRAEAIKLIKKYKSFAKWSNINEIPVKVLDELPKSMNFYDYEQYLINKAKVCLLREFYSITEDDLKDG